MDFLFGFAQSLEGGHIVQKLCHGQLVKQPEVLGQIAQTGFQLPFSFRKGPSIHQNTAFCGQKRRHQQLHQSGFTRAVGPEQADQTGGAQVKAEIFQRLLSIGICLTDILNIDFHIYLRSETFLPVFSGYQEE